MSFMMLSESQIAEARNGQHAEPPKPAQTKSATGTHVPGDVPQENLLSYKIETSERLFEILSARSDIDHPICVECTEMLVDGLQKRLAAATRERDAYIEFLRQANADIPTDEEVSAAEVQLKQAQTREDAALAELERLEKEKAGMDKEIRALDEEASKLDEEEEAFWAERNAFSTKLAEFQNERERINTKYEHDDRQFQRLQRTNVFNDAFQISHDGNFATINSLRLGRMANKSVEWAEINAALGQCCLLLTTIAGKLGFTFEGYELKPLGSHSSVYRIESSSTDAQHPSKAKKTELPLHNSGELTFNLVGFRSKFDNAMVAFLDCVKQLGEFVARTTWQGQDGSVRNGPELPYRIDKDKIGEPGRELSVKLGGKDEEWSKANKYLLTCLKFLLAHTSNVSSVPRRPG